MATPAPFKTSTVDAKKPVVDDKLKPTAEMHILVGGPYTVDGEEHRYGHTALRIISKGVDTTYDFGRYGKVTGTFGESGDGILRVWTDFKPYIASENALKRKTTGFVYAIFDHQAAAVTTHFDSLIKSGTAYPNKNRTAMKVYRLNTDYHALGPNCTTLSLDGATKALPKIDDGSERYNKPADVLSMGERLALTAKGGAPRLFLPDNLLKFLSGGSLEKPIRTDVYGGGK
ncbi:hypothetical protein LXA47_15955 [Massilia sp. P8910]|uniref:hypothetical protein n=1 Tax=Massilia antarctica TaxID=2765360 RepID=UPI001E3CF8B2|nr:hypothetical protein [Massilia antarctica]MCE3605096.1 hypothetical protein [Massilia antarctica]